MDNHNQLVPLRLLARELRVDRSHFRRYVLRLGISPQKRHTHDSGNKLVVTVTAEEADRIRAARRKQGYALEGGELDEAVGVFYVLQLVPELDPNRVKLGFADDAAARLSQHRTAAPTAKMLKTWPCKRSWEWTVIDALSTAGCKLILNEVYECCELARLLAHGDQLFELLPDPTKAVELSDVSPKRNGERRGSDERSSSVSAMRKVHRHHRVFWVGSLRRRNSPELGLVVFDPSSQPDYLTRKCVDLFEAAENSLGEFRREVVRELIGAPDAFGEAAIQAAIDQYCRAFGVDAGANRTTQSPAEHESICWNCWQNGSKVVVNSRAHMGCQSCGWVQCPECGACRDAKFGGCPVFHGLKPT